MKRIFLFLVTNILVVLTITILLNFLGIGNYLSEAGIDYWQLFLFCLVWGFAGSFISLLLSKVMAKFLMGVHTVDRLSPEFGWLVHMIEQLSARAGLPKVPEVGVYESPEVNAFATGPSKRMSLVAFSTGLLSSMSRDEIEGVAAHELAHIKNGDMVTMTLLQGIMNAFVMFFARVIAFAISQNVRDESRATVNMLVTIVLQIVLGLLGAIVVAAFSRWREFRADRGSATMAGREKMIAALQRLQAVYQPYDKQASVASLKIAGMPGRLFATHPPLKDRIAALAAA